ncbi:hypothetical protein HDU92_002353 [Lobulomyces angularis]|nr:hypothetical protein HDU92_002353 [Lobulomyces angularis]
MSLDVPKLHHRRNSCSHIKIDYASPQQNFPSKPSKSNVLSISFRVKKSLILIALLCLFSIFCVYKLNSSAEFFEMEIKIPVYKDKQLRKESIDETNENKILVEENTNKNNNVVNVDKKFKFDDTTNLQSEEKKIELKKKNNEEAEEEKVIKKKSELKKKSNQEEKVEEKDTTLNSLKFNEKTTVNDKLMIPGTNLVFETENDRAIYELEQWFKKRSYLKPKKEEEEIFKSVFRQQELSLKYIQENKKYINKVQRIPKIIHQIWISNEKNQKLPVFHQIEKCKLINPDFEFKLWTNDNIDELKFINKEYFQSWRSTSEISGAADVLRYDILYQFGGIYVDVDTICLRPFNELLNKEFFAGYEMLNNINSLDPTNKMIANGIIGSTKSYPLIGLMREIIKTRKVAGDTAWIEVGPAFLSRSVEYFKASKYSLNFNYEILNYTIFYPYHHSEANARLTDKGREVRLNSICMPTVWGNENDFDAKFD